MSRKLCKIVHDILCDRYLSPLAKVFRAVDHTHGHISWRAPLREMLALGYAAEVYIHTLQAVPD